MLGTFVHNSVNNSHQWVSHQHRISSFLCSVFLKWTSALSASQPDWFLIDEASGRFQQISLEISFTSQQKKEVAVWWHGKGEMSDMASWQMIHWKSLSRSTGNSETTILSIHTFPALCARQPTSLAVVGSANSCWVPTVSCTVLGAREVKVLS